MAVIDHNDVMGNIGSLVLERIDFDHQFLAFAERDPDSYAQIRCALQGGSTGATFGIPASGALTFTFLFSLVFLFKMNEWVLD